MSALHAHLGFVVLELYKKLKNEEWRDHTYSTFFSDVSNSASAKETGAFLFQDIQLHFNVIQYFNFEFHKILYPADIF